MRATYAVRKYIVMSPDKECENNPMGIDASDSMCGQGPVGVVYAPNIGTAELGIWAITKETNFRCYVVPEAP